MIYVNSLGSSQGSMDGERPPAAGGIGVHMPTVRDADRGIQHGGRPRPGWGCPVRRRRPGSARHNWGSRRLGIRATDEPMDRKCPGAAVAEGCHEVHLSMATENVSVLATENVRARELVLEEAQRLEWGSLPGAHHDVAAPRASLLTRWSTSEYGAHRCPVAGRGTDPLVSSGPKHRHQFQGRAGPP